MDWQVIDDCIAKKSLLKHPYYQAWSQGALTLEDLRSYAGQYYALESTFPRLLSRIHSACDNPSVRQGILENLIDEERDQNNNHLKLWKDFAQGVGAEEEEVTQVKWHPNTERCVQSLLELAANPNPVVGLAALYAYESQLPAISASKIAGLKEFYGIDDPKALRFFEVHNDVDAWHAQQEQTMLTELNATEEGVLNAVEASCDALWTFLDGVHATRLERLGVDAEPCMC